MRARTTTDRRTVSFGIVMLATIFMLAQGGKAGYAQQRFISEYSQDHTIVEVPFLYREHQILVHGDIDDKKNLTLLFDSGASAPVIDTSLGIQGYHLADTTIHEAEGDTASESIWVGDISLGEANSAVHVHNIAVLTADLSQISSVLGQKIDGIIGVPFMAGFVTEIDYEKKNLRFRSSRNYTIADRKPDNQHTFAFDLTPANAKRNVSCMLLTGQLQPKYEYDFLFDTGFSGYVSIAHAAAEQAGTIKADTPRASATSYSVSRSFHSDKIRAGFLMLGEINLSGRVIAIDSRNNDAEGQTGIVGNRFLQNYRVTFDLPRHKLWLERVTTKQELDEAETPTLGLVVRNDGKTIVVDRVKKYSPAQHSGIHPGDEIVSIDGHDVSTMGTQAATDLLASPHGMTALVLKRAIDPNLGTRPEPVTLQLNPASPLDWKVE